MVREREFRFDESDAVGIAGDFFGLSGKAERLDSYIDQNFLIRTADGKKFVLKIHNSMEQRDVVDFQNNMMEHIHRHDAGIECSRALPNLSGDAVTVIGAPGGERHLARLLTFVDGEFWADEKEQGEDFLEALGGFFGRIDNALQGFDHPGAHRRLVWDLKNARDSEAGIAHIEDPRRRSLVAYFLLSFEKEIEPILGGLRQSVIHADGNDYNVLITKRASAVPEALGIIDFGDAVYTPTVCEAAIAATYAAFHMENPISAMGAVIRGYHSSFPLLEREIGVIFHLVAARLCISVISSAGKIKEDPNNAYLTVSEKPAWKLLEHLGRVNPLFAENAFRRACGLPARIPRVRETLKKRERLIGPSLSIAYGEPIKIVRGRGQFLFDETGKTYLDMVNNVCHVGHCHPTVVKAAAGQMSLINTNTRYLGDSIVEYAKRLVATMPGPLEVCFFVCSGSEANELALRMARTHTARRDVLVLDGAYHGNTTAMIELSPYKFSGKGGRGASSHVHVVPMPDPYRGPYKASDPGAASKYADHVKDALAKADAKGSPAAMFIAESLLGCGGQIVLPEGYLEEAQKHVKEAGAVFVVDEVQVGFGRMGSHFWGFETEGVVPDIVTLGKPMGNGHPLAAVVTTREIASSFNNGMEYFNTFGGNPVSCSVGMAVLDVIEQESLMQNALEVGEKLLFDLSKLKSKHDLIGDVRGRGLYMGIELVKDPQTLEPAAGEANRVVELMKNRGVLLSTDGPLHNVLKIKPPIVITKEDAERFVGDLDGAFSELR